MSLAESIPELRARIAESKRILEPGYEVLDASLKDALQYLDRGATPPLTERLSDPGYLPSLLKPREFAPIALGYLAPIAATWIYFLLAGGLTFDTDAAALTWWNDALRLLPIDFHPFVAWVLVFLVIGVAGQTVYNWVGIRRRENRGARLYEAAATVSLAAQAMINAPDRKSGTDDVVHRLSQATEALRAVAGRFDSGVITKIQAANDQLSRTSHAVSLAVNGLGGAADQVVMAMANLAENAESWNAAAEASAQQASNMRTAADRLETQLYGLPSNDSLVAVFRDLKKVAEDVNEGAKSREDSTRNLMSVAENLTQATDRLRALAQEMVPLLAYLEGKYGKKDE